MNETNDEQHLNLLSIFHYVVAAMTALISCFPLIHLTVGIGVIISGLTHPQRSGFPDVLFGLIFVVFAGTFILLGWALAICIALTGRYLTQRKRYMFCLVIAAIECMLTPFGTVLGVFSIIVLVRPSVKALFAA